MKNQTKISIKMIDSQPGFGGQHGPDYPDNQQKEVLLYPNPAKNYIQLEITDNSNPSFIELFDVHGRLVLKEEIQQDKQIQVKHLQRGLYLYKLNYDNTIKTGKIVLQ